jgi:hypothetical protein
VIVVQRSAKTSCFVCAVDTQNMSSSKLKVPVTDNLETFHYYDNGCSLTVCPKFISLFLSAKKT